MRNAAQLVSTLGALVMAATPLLAAAGAAHAQEAPSMRVRTADLDFSRATAQATFDRRVQAAGDALCGNEGPAELARIAACQAAVREQAAAQLRQVRAAAPAAASASADR